MSDFTILLRDVAGDAAQNAATRINPSEDALNQIDHPAEDNTWHDVPTTGDLKSQAQAKFNKNKPFSKGDLQDAAGDASANTAGTRDPAEAGAAAQNQGLDGVDAVGGASAAAGTLKDKASANVPDETKDQARDKASDLKNRSKSYMQNKVPKERRDQTIYRLKKMIVEIQSHSDCEYDASCQRNGS